MVNSPLIRPSLLGGGTLGSHEDMNSGCINTKKKLRPNVRFFWGHHNVDAKRFENPHSQVVTISKLQLSSDENPGMTFHYTDWFNRDPYFMVFYNPYINWVGFHPLYKTTNQGELNTAQLC